MKLKGFIFDMDGTLVDTLPICVGANAAAIAMVTGRLPSDEEVLSHFGLSEEGILEKMAPGRLAETLPAFLQAYETQHSSVQRPFAGVEQVLAWLRSRSLTQRRSRFAFIPLASATLAIETPGLWHA